jgi:hypothetical protein
MRKSSPPRSLAPAAIAARSNAPTPEYRTHHRVVAPSIDGRTYRPYWSQRTRLVRLLEEGAIDREAFAAGVTLRGWCETLFRG